MKKKFLLILTVLIVFLMGLTAVACTDYTSPTEETESEETVTRTQLITNGTFYNARGTSTDSYVKQTVTGWSATKGSLETSGNGVTMGVIDLANTASYNLNKDKFSVADHTDFVNPGVDPETPFDTDDEGEVTEDRQDTNALVIASNQTAGSVYYKNSSSYTLQAGKYYRLQYSVCTVIDKTDVAEGDKDKVGAWVHLTGAVEYLNPCIDTEGQWKTYYVYIEAKKTGTATIDLRLWLGNGPEKINDVTNVYLTKGAAMFDNFICTEVTEATDPGYNEGSAVTLDHETFGALAVNEQKVNAYVSTYYLADLGLTQLNESYYTPTTTNAVKYYYSFREGSYISANAKNYTLVVGKNGLTSDKPTVTNAFTGVVDFAKLYGENHEKNTYSTLLGSSYVFDAPSYDDWSTKVMNGVRGDLNDLSETKGLMLYYSDLSAAGLTNKSTFTVEKDKNYIVSVWAYVWAPYKDGDFVYPTANAPTKPAEYTETQQVIRDYYLNGTEENGLFYGYFDALTTEEQAIVDGTAPTPATAINDINALLASEAFTTAFNARYDAKVADLFKYKFLKEKFADYVTSEDLAAGDESYVEYQYLRERSNFLKNTFATLKTLMEKWDKYDNDYLTYMSKYTVWRDNNDRPYATVKLTGAGDDLTETTETFNEGWEKIEFFVAGSQLSSRELTLELWFGEGTATEYENLMFGGVFFDNVDIQEVTSEQKAETYGDKEWKVLSPLTDENELTFGGLINDEVVEDHWTDELAENVAKSDAESVSVEYIANESIGSVTLGGNVITLQELVLTHAIPTASIVDCLDTMTIKKNTAYRLAIWAKTEDIASGKGVTIALVGGTEADVEKMSVLSSVTTFNSTDWQEIVFYILGDSQVTNYVSLQLTMGSGTRFSTDGYIQGAAHLAVINCSEIKYSEYNSSSKSGDQVKSYSFSNTATATDSVTNGNFSSIDLNKTSVDEFDAEGGLKDGGVASVTGWTQSAAKNNTFNTITLSSTVVSGEEYKLSWTDVKGIDYRGAETAPTAYEVYAKFSEEGAMVERLYSVVPVGTTELNVDLTGVKTTSFRVRAVSDKAVSSFSDYVTPVSGRPDGTVLVAKGGEPDGKKEIKAGAVNNEGLFAGSDYVSPYKTSLAISSNYAVAQSMVASDKSLSANSYYYVTVWVKTVGDAKAAVTVGNVSKVLTAERENSYIGYADISTGGKWTQYGFYIKTGTISTSFGLELSLGNPYAAKASKKIGTSTSNVTVYDDADLSMGTVYFDSVKVLTVDKAEYEAAVDENVLTDFDYLYDGANNQYVFKKLVYTTDSFDSFTENTTAEGSDGYNLGNTPNNYTWAKAADATGSSEKERLYGVYNYSTDSADKLEALFTTTDSETGDETNAFADFLPDGFSIRDFIQMDGFNSLVMSNKVSFGQNYVTSSSYTVNSKTYYKITFKAKTLLPEGKNAAFRYMPSGSSDEYQTIVINTQGAADAVEYTMYIYNPSATSSSAKWGFFLGANANEKDTTGTEQLTKGMLVVDQVSIESIEEEAFTEAKTAYDALSDDEKVKAGTVVYSYKEDATPEEEGGEEGDDSGNSGSSTSIWDRGDAWLLISSIVIAVVIVVVVIVVVIRRWKKKHPRETVVENNVNTGKKVEKEEPAPAPTEEAEDETEEYSDEVERPVYVQRVVRKDKKKKK